MCASSNKRINSLTSLADYLGEARGVGSTLWGWITYPFSWWSSGDQAPVNDQLIGSTTYGPYDTISLGNNNVTVWCNDQTCTTMKCDPSGCSNITCNIYDTNMSGECRVYNMFAKPEEPIPTKPAESTDPTLQDKVTEGSKPEIASVIPVPSTTQKEPIDEHPLELEAVLSSTVTESSGKVSEVKENKSPGTQNKVFLTYFCL